MAQEIAIKPVNLVALISSPDLRRLRRISMGTVQHPGQRPRRYLSAGSTLTSEDRARAIQIKSELENTVAAYDRQASFGLIAKMLLAYPIGNASEETGKARGEAYLEALSDISPSILAEAIRRWNRGEAGGDHDYRWAPAPAVLRQICNNIKEPVADIVQDLNNLLSAVSIERAMDPTPIESESKLINWRVA